MTRHQLHANDNRPIWFDELLLRYEPYLRKRCAAMLPDSADDAYQEVTCRALARWHKFKPDGHFPTWLNYIVRTIRHEAQKPKAAHNHTPRIQPPTQEFAFEAYLATRNLSPLNSQMISMLASGHTFVEVAAAQGVAPQSVQGRAGRVWKAMRAANDNKANNAAA